MTFSVSSFIASFVFSIFGFYFFREGKKEGNVKLILIGITMIIYTYFTKSAWVDWSLGLALSYAGYYFFKN